MAFVDKARVFIQSGRGGNGHISFRREKFVPAGGPDGGDGGDGGSVIFVVDEGQNTLEDYRHASKFSAPNGEDGKGRNMTGRRGEDLILKVPEGTLIREASSGRVITDLSGDNRRCVILKGGRGGKGNQHFASSTMQAPKFAEPGGEAKTLEILMELKVIADVGLVGFPSVGKSTLLSIVSNAKPKIAAYHFTTLTPMLGVVDLPDAHGFVMADIPGLIEGAADGAGLGDEFLQHIERCKILIHMVDASGSEGRDPLEDIEKINHELEKYSIDLMKKKIIIAANKMDLIPADLLGTELDPVLRIREKYEPLGYQIFPISTATRQGVREMLYTISSELDRLPKGATVYASEYDPETELAAQSEAPVTVSYDEDSGMYVVEGPGVERMLDRTNLETEKGLAFLQKFVEERGINDRLKELGIHEGDIVRLYGHTFEYYQ